MNPLPSVSPVHTSGPALARLGANHGYRFGGDSVRLHAMFTVLDEAAHDRAWSLQLWACPQAPVGAGSIAGHCIAEAPLPPIGEIADDAECFAVEALATPPAGSAEHILVLALVARSALSGEEVQDFAVYPRREYLFQPRLGGHGRVSRRA